MNIPDVLLPSPEEVENARVARSIVKRIERRELEKLNAMQLQFLINTCELNLRYAEEELFLTTIRNELIQLRKNNPLCKPLQEANFIRWEYDEEDIRKGITAARLGAIDQFTKEQYQEVIFTEDNSISLEQALFNIISPRFEQLHNYYYSLVYIELDKIK